VEQYEEKEKLPRRRGSQGAERNVELRHENGTNEARRRSRGANSGKEE